MAPSDDRGGKKRRLAIALGIYAVVVATYFSLIPRYRILEHTPFNHFSLLAEAWLKGRLDLGGPPPGYAQNNDFASFGGKYFVAFPPFPAVLILPVVWIGKTAANVRDAQFFLWMAGIGPAVLFLGLEKLRRTGRSERSERENAALCLLLAFGSVYFFTALQGTVWFAAHLVAVALGAIYLLAALDAERPIVAGLMIGLGFHTRTPLLFAFPLFLFEAVRVSLLPLPAPVAVEGSAEGAPEPAARAPRFATLRRVDYKKLAKLVVPFAVPIALLLLLALFHNQRRFGRWGDFGYEHLTVAWAARMKKWGLFDYHYLARNLGVVLTQLPWYDPKGRVPFQINQHGLALWFTTPLYLWLLWPKQRSTASVALYATALAVAVPGLFYQNTGWMQFGYRFSNDYAVFLFALLAVIGNPFGKLFWTAALFAVAVNTFGAVTFERGDMKKFYFEDASQKVYYQPD